MQPTDPNQFTEKAWEAIVKSQDVARRWQNQQLEVEHLLYSLLEQEGLTKTILESIPIDCQRWKRQIEEFAQRQPRVSNPDQLYLGRSLELWLDRSDAERRQRQDEFISIEHFLLSLAEDERIGRKLMRSANCDRQQIESAVKKSVAVRELLTKTLKRSMPFSRSTAETSLHKRGQANSTP